MKIQGVPFALVNWNEVASSEHPGKNGKATWRTFEEGNVRVRMVDYTPGFILDHWCGRGHVLLVLQGELVIELMDGRKFTLHSGTSFQVEDNETNPHRLRTEVGARVFIVD